MNHSVLRTAAFDKDLAALRKRFRGIDRDVERLEQQLAADPIRGSRALPRVRPLFRKIRLAVKSQKQGNSGGCRVVYRVLESGPFVALVMIFSKHDHENVAPGEIERAWAASQGEIRQKLIERGYDPDIAKL